MVATQNERVRVPRKFIRRYHLKQLFYDRFPDKDERKAKVTELANQLKVVNGVIKKYWNIRPEDNSDITAQQLRKIAEFFDIEMIELWNIRGEVY